MTIWAGNTSSFDFVVDATHMLTATFGCSLLPIGEGTRLVDGVDSDEFQWLAIVVAELEHVFAEPFDRLVDIDVMTLESVVPVLHSAAPDRKRCRGGLRLTDTSLCPPLVGEEGDERAW